MRQTDRTTESTIIKPGIEAGRRMTPTTVHTLNYPVIVKIPIAGVEQNTQSWQS